MNPLRLVLVSFLLLSCSEPAVGAAEKETVSLRYVSSAHGELVFRLTNSTSRDVLLVGDRMAINVFDEWSWVPDAASVRVKCRESVTSNSWITPVESLHADGQEHRFLIVVPAGKQRVLSLRGDAASYSGRFGCRAAVTLTDGRIVTSDKFVPQLRYVTLIGGVEATVNLESCASRPRVPSISTGFDMTPWLIWISSGDRRLNDVPRGLSSQRATIEDRYRMLGPKETEPADSFRDRLLKAAIIAPADFAAHSPEDQFVALLARNWLLVGKRNCWFDVKQDVLQRIGTTNRQLLRSGRDPVEMELAVEGLALSGFDGVSLMDVQGAHTRATDMYRAFNCGTVELSSATEDDSSILSIASTSIYPVNVLISDVRNANARGFCMDRK